ncbi:MAG: glucose-1-phosphate thymidylyltransferase [Thermotogae bacterium]|jgi:glucose-1-phosphate thymidylyltransferase|nr:glucose-1-phosphate thymidylyltransferase [Thermotogota bacterium]MCL5032990.1 glucose-1-phosphate thymidylyltransferase [Thermotogota bacterium]
MKAIILCAGKGTRLRPLTFTSAKQLIPVANKPVILYSIEKIKEIGISDIGMIVNTENVSAFQDALGDGSQFGVKLSYIIQTNPKGLADAVSVAKDFLDGETFLMYLGDNLIQEDLVDFARDFEQKKLNASILLTPVDDPSRFGVAVVNGDAVLKVVEKPQNPPSNLAITGVYLFDSSIFEGIANIKPSWRGELEITDAIQYLIEKSYKVRGHVIYGWWKDTGRPEDLLEANRRILENVRHSRKNGSINGGSKIEGHVIIEEGVEIINSIVRGPASIDKNSTVMNSYIGPYTSIGQNVTIENAEIENSILLENSVVRDVDVRIDSSIIGKSATVSSIEKKPKVHNLVIGDYSSIKLG